MKPRNEKTDPSIRPKYCRNCRYFSGGEKKLTEGFCLLDKYNPDKRRRKPKEALKVIAPNRQSCKRSMMREAIIELPKESPVKEAERYSLVRFADWMKEYLDITEYITGFAKMRTFAEIEDYVYYHIRNDIKEDIKGEKNSDEK